MPQKSIPKDRRIYFNPFTGEGECVTLTDRNRLSSGVIGGDLVDWLTPTQMCALLSEVYHTPQCYGYYSFYELWVPHKAAAHWGATTTEAYNLDPKLKSVGMRCMTKCGSCAVVGQCIDIVKTRTECISLWDTVYKSTSRYIFGSGTGSPPKKEE